jgi:hypothetical protein
MAGWSGGIARTNSPGMKKRVPAMRKHGLVLARLGLFDIVNGFLDRCRVASYRRLRSLCEQHTLWAAVVWRKLHDALFDLAEISSAPGTPQTLCRFVGDGVDSQA